MFLYFALKSSSAAIFCTSCLCHYLLPGEARSDIYLMVILQTLDGVTGGGGVGQVQRLNDQANCKIG